MTFADWKKERLFERDIFFFGDSFKLKLVSNGIWSGWNFEAWDCNYLFVLV